VSWLLDTNVLSEIRRSERANDRVREWYAGTREEDLFTSVLVLGELRRGIDMLRSRDVIAAQALEQWVARLKTTFRERVLPVDARVAERWGQINVPDRLPAVDSLLAATALVHDMTLVTRDLGRLERTGVRLLDPWTA
jgi:predicted nucleic acid-binding protein